MEIVKVPSPILRKKSEEVKKIDLRVKGLINDMVKTLREAGGLGLAAPQVSHLLKIIVIESKGGKNKHGEERPIIPLTILINPKVTKCSRETEKDHEGCLSIPEIWGIVERPKLVTIKALNEKGKSIKIKAQELFARSLQHEIDHLNGILFTDKADLSTLHKIGPDGEIIKIKL